MFVLYIHVHMHIYSFIMCAYLLYMRISSKYAHTAASKAYSRIDAFDKPLEPPTDAPTTLAAVFQEFIKHKYFTCFFFP